MTKWITRALNRREFVATGAYALTVSMAMSSKFVAPLVAASPYPADQPEAGSADWPRYGYDLHNTRWNVNEKTLGKNNVDRLKLKWQFDIREPIETTPTVLGDTLFFGAPGAFYALDSATGQLKWKFDMPRGKSGNVRRGLQFYKGRVYSGNQAGWFFCVDAATGQLVWERDFSKNPEPGIAGNSGFSGACTAFEDRIFVGTTGYKNRFMCLNADTGVTMWEYWITGENDIGKGGSMWTAPAVDEKQRIVYIVTGSNKLPGSWDHSLFTESILAFDIDTGYLLWYYQPSPNDPHDIDWSCHPVILDAQSPPMRKGAVRQCVAAGKKDGFYCFNRYTGELYWRVQLTQLHPYGGPNVDEIAFNDNKVYVLSNAATQLIGKPPLSVTAALHAYTGAIVWWTYNLDGIIQGAISGANGLMFQGFNDGRMQALDADFGRVLWEYTLPTSRRGGIAIANGNVYCSCGIPGALQLGGAAGMNDPELVAIMRRAANYSVFCFSIDGK